MNPVNTAPTLSILVFKDTVKHMFCSTTPSTSAGFAKGDGHIDAEELAETFSRLRHKIKKARALLQIQGSSFDVLISSELCMQCS